MKYLKNINLSWFKGDTMKIPLKTVLMLFVVVGLMCAWSTPASASIIRECGSQALCEDPIVGCGGEWINHSGDPNWPYFVLNACHIEGKVWTDNSHIIARGGWAALIGPFTTHFDEAITGVAVAGSGPIVDATVLGPVGTAFVLQGEHAICVRCVAGPGSERPFRGMTLNNGATAIEPNIETRSAAVMLAGDGVAVVDGSLRTAGRSAMIDMSPGIEDGYVGGVTLGPTFDNPGRAGNYVTGRGNVHFDDNDASGADMGIVMFEGEMTVTNNRFADTGIPDPRFDNGVITALRANTSAEVANNQFIGNHDSDYNLDRSEIRSLPEQSEDRRRMLDVMTNTARERQGRLASAVGGRGSGSKEYGIFRKLYNQYGFVISQEEYIRYHVDSIAESAAAYPMITESALAVRVAEGDSHVGELMGFGHQALRLIVVIQGARERLREVNYGPLISQGALSGAGEGAIRAAFRGMEALDDSSIVTSVTALDSETDIEVNSTKDGGRVAKCVFLDPRVKPIEADKLASIKMDKAILEGLQLAQDVIGANTVDCTVTEEWTADAEPIFTGKQVVARMLDVDEELLKEATIKLDKSLVAILEDLISAAIERAMVYGDAYGRETAIQVVAYEGVEVDDALFSIKTVKDDELLPTEEMYHNGLLTGTMSREGFGKLKSFTYEEAARLQRIDFYPNAAFTLPASVAWTLRRGHQDSASYPDGSTIEDIIADLAVKISFPFEADIQVARGDSFTRSTVVASSCYTGLTVQDAYGLCENVGQAYFMGLDPVSGNAIFKLLLPDTEDSLKVIFYNRTGEWAFGMLTARLRDMTLRLHPMWRPKIIR